MPNDRVEDMLSQLIKMVGSIHQEQQEMKTGLYSVTSKLQEMDEKLNAVIVDQQQMKLDLAQVKEHIGEVSQSVNYLVHKTGEHDKDIYVLKHRLID